MAPSRTREVSRRAFLGMVAAGSVAPLSLAARTEAAEVAKTSDGTVEVLKQRNGEGSCGPCAIGNSLLRGDAGCRRAFRTLPGANDDARVDALIARYGSRSSETYGKTRARFVPSLGIANDDLGFLANDLLRDAGLAAVDGQWLDKAANEGGVLHTRRVHGLLKSALARGMPPIVEIRSFAADAGNVKEPWENLSSHIMALAAVEPGELDAEALGFACRFADSSSGRVIPAFVSAEIFRPFNATRGFKVRADGTKDWLWVTGKPYLLVTIPDLPMYANTQPLSARTLIALTYMLGRGA